MNYFEFQTILLRNKLKLNSQSNLAAKPSPGLLQSDKIGFRILYKNRLMNYKIITTLTKSLRSKNRIMPQKSLIIHD